MVGRERALRPVGRDVARLGLVHHPQADPGGRCSPGWPAHHTGRSLGGQHEVQSERAPALRDVEQPGQELRQISVATVANSSTTITNRAGRSARPMRPQRSEVCRPCRGEEPFPAAQLGPQTGQTARGQRRVEIGDQRGDVWQAGHGGERRAALVVDQDERRRGRWRGRGQTGDQRDQQFGLARAGGAGDQDDAARRAPGRARPVRRRRCRVPRSPVPRPRSARAGMRSVRVSSTRPATEPGPVGQRSQAACSAVENVAVPPPWVRRARPIRRRSMGRSWPATSSTAVQRPGSCPGSVPCTRARGPPFVDRSTRRRRHGEVQSGTTTTERRGDATGGWCAAGPRAGRVPHGRTAPDRRRVQGRDLHQHDRSSSRQRPRPATPRTAPGRQVDGHRNLVDPERRRLRRRGTRDCPTPTSAPPNSGSTGRRSHSRTDGSGGPGHAGRRIGVAVPARPDGAVHASSLGGRPLLRAARCSASARRCDRRPTIRSPSADGRSSSRSGPAISRNSS